MIPKRIISAWFGRGEKAEHFKKCIATWSQVCPEYEIIEVNEDNLPSEIMESPYMQGVMARREFVKATELARLWGLYRWGGVYLDADVKIVKPLDDLLDQEFFIGLQGPNEINGAVIGSTASNPTIKYLLTSFVDGPLRTPGTERADTYGPIFLQNQLKIWQHRGNKITVYPPEYFYPHRWDQDIEDAIITPNTHCIHIWAKSWVKPIVTIVVNGHREGTTAYPTLKAARRASRQLDGYVELLGVVDRGDAETLRVFKERCDRVIEVDNGDLGLSRNDGIRAARSKYVCFCDSDDLFGVTWVRDAYRMAESGYQDAVLHSQWWFFFGDRPQPFLQERVGTNDPRFNPDYMTMTNPLGSLAFASRETFLRHPYKAIEPGFGYEDWQWNLDTLAAGVPHVCVPDTILWMRTKRQGSMCAAMRSYGATVLPTAYFDRKRLPAHTPYRLAELNRSWFVDEARAANQVEPIIQFKGEVTIMGPEPTPVAEPIWNGCNAVPSGGVIVLVPNWSPENQLLATSICDHHDNAVIIVTDGVVNAVMPSKYPVVSLGIISFADRMQALQTIAVQRQVSVVHCINDALGLAVLRQNPLVIKRTATFYLWSTSPVITGDALPPDANFTELPFCWKDIDKIFVTDIEWVKRLHSMYGIPADAFMVLG